MTLWELFTLGQEPYGDSTTPGHIIQVKIIIVVVVMMMPMMMILRMMWMMTMPMMMIPRTMPIFQIDEIV